MSKGKLFIFSGPSGVGKGTVIKALLQKIPGLTLSVSVTTRQPRAGEEEGKDYYFTDKAGFEKMKADGRFLESAEHYGIYYGTPKSFVDKELKNGKSVLLEIDTNGAFQVKSKMPESISIFLTYPNIEELRSRLVNRGSETEESLKLRLEKAVAEHNDRNRFDYVVVNNDLSDTIARIMNIFKGEMV